MYPISKRHPMSKSATLKLNNVLNLQLKRFKHYSISHATQVNPHIV